MVLRVSMIEYDDLLTKCIKREFVQFQEPACGVGREEKTKDKSKEDKSGPGKPKGGVRLMACGVGKRVSHLAFQSFSSFKKSDRCKCFIPSTSLPLLNSSRLTTYLG